MNPQVKSGEQQRPQVSPVAQILVVDDDTCMFEVFRQLLPPPRYFIVTAADGSQALKLAANQTFDVAFVDYYMSHMDGAEVSQELRKKQPNIQIILITGYLVHDRAAIMERAGSRVFLTKPFSAKLVQSTVERLLTDKGQHPTAAQRKQSSTRAEIP